MAKLTDHAAAKVNLTLEVKGKRFDGYHEVESLVVFADYGDTLSFMPSAAFSLSVDGPFAAALESSGNLIEKAARAFADLIGEPPGGAFHLTKRLPVEAGVGGGSADAGAALRLLQRHYGSPVPMAELAAAARGIGADVPVCLASSAAFMTGIGETLYPLPRVEPIPAILVNPMERLATAPVFRALAAARLSAGFSPAEPARLATSGEVVAFAAEKSNDLEPPACRLKPVIAEILRTLEALPGALLARLSGSGPTCFAIFGDMQAAESAARTVAGRYSGWWVRPVKLR